VVLITGSTFYMYFTIPIMTAEEIMEGELA